MAKADTESQEKVNPEIEFARKRQAVLRKEAPKGVSMGRVWKSPFDRKVEMYAPECLGKNREFAGFWGEPELHKERLMQGYEPVIVDGQQVREGKMLLYKRPTEFLNRELKQASDISYERIRADLDDGGKNDGLHGASVEVKNGSLGE